MLPSIHHTIYRRAAVILKKRLGCPPGEEELSLFVHVEAAKINSAGGESLTKLTSAQSNKLAALFKGMLENDSAYRADCSRRKKRAGGDSPWASDAHKKFYADFCRWAGWSEERRDGFLKHLTGVETIAFKVRAFQLNDCIEGAAQIMTREELGVTRRVTNAECGAFKERFRRARYKKAGEN